MLSRCRPAPSNPDRSGSYPGGMTLEQRYRERVGHRSSAYARGIDLSSRRTCPIQVLVPLRSWLDVLSPEVLAQGAESRMILGARASTRQEIHERVARSLQERSFA